MEMVEEILPYQLFTNIPDEEHLEVNDHITNLIILSEKLGIWGGSIESGCGSPNSSNKNDDKNSYHLVYLAVVACLTSSVHYHVEMKGEIISQNEAMVRRFTETFSAARWRN